MTTVLHVSPHADDEMLGCPGTLLALRDAGARVVDFLLNLSEPEGLGRRRSEAFEAHRRSGIELRLLDASALPKGGVRVDPAAAEDRVAEALNDLLAELKPDVVVGPQPHDIHEAHELAGRAVRRALEGRSSHTRWWMWGIWADLPLPTLLTPFDGGRLEEIIYVLAAYKGEVARNDYRSLVRGRGLVGAVAGSERVFGFGAATASAEPYADLLTEVRLNDGDWILSGPATFAGDLPDAPAVATVTAWLDESTAAAHLARWRMSQARKLFG